ncbi:type II toxin-antitoxin system RelE/ParE family toxin [Rudanella lutea]|uniref:type II toxin-antitoxin system RelE/ParE family toxin n=1 Tax=Rudanella lutea TaxID=451374 RepID=UPI000361A9ED|nr:type II toxin-antitoxin system RelE/ParE family toxin [Rudanella lutea]
MANQIIPTDLFEAKFKRLKKKFRTLENDLKELTDGLVEKPTLGESLGAGLHKVRLASKSKNKGKSGGFRIITYLVVQTEDSTDIYLLTIYDKSEESTIHKDKLVALAKALLG